VPAKEISMSPRKGQKGTGRRPTPSVLSPGSESAVMTLRDLAEYLHCHYATALRLVRQGAIPSFKLGGAWRFLKSDVDKWIAKGGGRKPSVSPSIKTEVGRRRRKPRRR
jgi:excisionase family DNA binding protein